MMSTVREKNEAQDSEIVKAKVERKSLALKRLRKNLVAEEWFDSGSEDKNETPPPSKTSPLVDDDLDEEEAISEMFIEFVIQNQLFSYSLENFAQMIGIPYEGACVFSDRWRVDELIYGIPTYGPYQTNLPPVEDIISSIRVDRDG
ncbi:hypothetical protein Tco_1367429 [Tanacetum coccineum]